MSHMSGECIAVRATAVVIAAVAGVVAGAVVGLVPTLTAAADPPPLTASVTSIDFGDQSVPYQGVDYGTPYTITVTNSSATDQTIGTASFSGTDAAAFSIATAADGTTPEDTCSGQTLAAAATCTIAVVGNPSTIGNTINATLMIPETTPPGGDLSIPLTATGSDSPPVYVLPGPGYVDIYWQKLPEINGDVPTAYRVLKGTDPENLSPLGADQPATAGTIHDTAVTPTAPGVTPAAEYYYAVEPIVGSSEVDTTATLPAVPWQAGSKGVYVPVSASHRILDTRGNTGGHHGKVTRTSPVSLRVIGTGGIDVNGVGAVVLNLTGTNPSATLSLTVWPDGSPKPTVSDLNLTAGQTRANLITVPVGAHGRIDISTSIGSVDVILDTVGYYASAPVEDALTKGGQYQPFYDPTRLEDTRTPGEGALPAGYYDSIPLFDYGDLAPHLNSAIVNITATDATKSGYLTAFSTTAPPGGASTLNYTKGQTVSNMAIVPLGTCDQCNATTPAIDVLNTGLGSVDVIVDIVGLFDDDTLQGGAIYQPLSDPVRIVDTRRALGLPHALGSGSTTAVNPSPLGDLLTAAFDENATAVNPTRSTYVTFWPFGIAGLTRPITSNLNAAAGQVVPSHVINVAGTGNDVYVFNNFGITDLLIDVSGTFEFRPYPGDPGTNEASRALALRPAAPARTRRQLAHRPASAAPSEHPR
jgi:hypothetical protein